MHGEAEGLSWSSGARTIPKPQSCEACPNPRAALPEATVRFTLVTTACLGLWCVRLRAVDSRPPIGCPEGAPDARAHVLETDTAASRGGVS